MAQQLIDIGSTAGDGTGTNLRAGGAIINENFTELYAASEISMQTDSTVFVNSDDDFPNVSGGISTLNPNTRYVFADGLVTSLKIVITSGGVTMSAGGSPLSGVTFSGSGTFITIVNSNVQLSDIAIFAPSAQVFDASGTDSSTLVIRNSRISNCNKLGTINQVALRAINSTFSLFLDGWSFLGVAVLGLSILDSFYQDSSASSTVLDFGSATFLQIKIKGLVMNGTGTCLSSSVGGLNMIGANTALVFDCTFGAQGTMTPLSGFTDDFQAFSWEFLSSSPASVSDDSREAADSYLVVQNTITVAVQGDYYEMGIPASGAWQSDVSDRFTQDTSGTLTYIGQMTIKVLVGISATVEKSGGGQDEIEQRVGLNWSVGQVGIEKTKGSTQNASPTQVFSQAEIEMSTNDTIRPIYANLSGTSNIIASSISMVANKAG